MWMKLADPLLQQQQQKILARMFMLFLGSQIALVSKF